MRFRAKSSVEPPADGSQEGVAPGLGPDFPIIGSAFECAGLPNNQLSGGIPSELGSLASLEYTYLNDNRLRGPLPLELMNLTSLLDARSDLCDNQLYTTDDPLRSFLDSKQIGGHWESCQRAAPRVPMLSAGGVWASVVLLAGSALWAARRSGTPA